MSYEDVRKTLLAAALLSVGGVLGMSTSQAAGTYDRNAAPAHSPVPGKSSSDAQATTPSSTTAANALSASDRRFIETAAQGGIAQEELGKLAVQKAAAPEVKQFGQKMVDDHSKANQELKQLASGKDVPLATRMDAANQREYDKLEKLSGPGFDREYMRAMVSDHEADIKAFGREERGAKDADVKTFAKTTLPTLEEHLKLAKSDQAVVRAESRAATKKS